jgi:hypothetical protein
MDAENNLRVTVRWMIKQNADCVHTTLCVFDNTLKLSISPNEVEVYPSIDFVHDVSRLDILRLLVTVLEQEGRVRDEPLAFTFTVAYGVCMDLPLAKELARLAHGGRRVVLRGVTHAFQGDLDVALIPSFVRMVAPGSSIRQLGTSVALMTCMLERGIPADCSLEELVTSDEWWGSVIISFARTLHVKKLTLMHVGPVTGLADMPEMESLRVVFLGPHDDLEPILKSCPNLTSLRIEHLLAGGDVAVPFFHISSLRGLKELYVSVSQSFGGWQRDAVDFLSWMTSLRKLELHVYGFNGAMQTFLARGLPRLEDFVMESDGVGIEWEDAIMKKKLWLCRVAISSLTLGDLGRELAEYL